MKKLITNFFLLGLTFVCFDAPTESQLSKVCVNPELVTGFFQGIGEANRNTIVLQVRDAGMVPVKGTIKSVTKKLENGS